jgi:hypothetical protein
MSESNEIDRDKLRAAVRKLSNEYILYMFDDAIDLLPPTKLHKIAKKYLDVKRLRPDPEKANPSLLTDVKLFEKASLAGEYYESFDVNWKNSTQKSTGPRCYLPGSKSSPSRPARRNMRSGSRPCFLVTTATDGTTC